MISIGEDLPGSFLTVLFPVSEFVSLHIWAVSCIQSLDTLGLRCPLPCWLSPEGHSQFIDPLTSLDSGSCPPSSMKATLRVRVEFSGHMSLTYTSTFSPIFKDSYD